MKVDEPKKNNFYFKHYASLLSKQILKLTTPTFKNYFCSKASFYLKNNIFEDLSTQIFAMNVDESIKTIFCLTHYASLLK